MFLLSRRTIKIQNKLTDRKPIFKFHREAFDQALLFVQKYFLGSCVEPAWELWMALTFSGLLILIVASVFRLASKSFHP